MTRLAELAGRDLGEWAEWVNLLDRWPGSAGKGSAFPTTDGRVAAVALLSRLHLPRFAAVLLAGRRVAQAWPTPAYAHQRAGRLPYFEWGTTYDGLPLAVIPHPSAVNRFWNDRSNVERARMFLADVAGQPPDV